MQLVEERSAFFNLKTIFVTGQQRFQKGWGSDAKSSWRLENLVGAMKFEESVRSYKKASSHRDQTLDLTSDEVDLHAGEAVIEEHQQPRLLLQCHRRLRVAVDRLSRFEKTERHNPVKESLEVLGRFLERGPSRNTLAKLLVDHHDDGHDMRLRALLGVEVRPQVVLEILKIMTFKLEI